MTEEELYKEELIMEEFEKWVNTLHLTLQHPLKRNQKFPWLYFFQRTTLVYEGFKAAYLLYNQEKK